MRSKRTASNRGARVTSSCCRPFVVCARCIIVSLTSMMLPCAISATVQGYPQLKRAQVRPLQQTHHFPSPILSMFRSTLTCRLLVAIASTIIVNAQSYGENAFGRDRNASFPHTYPGMPEGELSPEWQNCTLFPFCALIDRKSVV